MHPLAKGMARAALAVCGMLAAGCGPGSATDDGGNGGGKGPFTAKVDGAAWAADPIGAYAMALASSPGSLIVGGTQNRDGTVISTWTSPGPWRRCSTSTGAGSPPT